MSIISLSGRMRCGKDTVGNIIQYLIAKDNFLKQNHLFNDQVSTFEEWNNLVIDKQRFSGWEIKKFAGPLRQVASILLGMNEEFLYTDEFKEMNLSKEWDIVKQVSENDENSKDGFALLPMTGREFLQKLGTEAIRNGLHTNAWVNALMSEYDDNTDNIEAIQLKKSNKKFIITDTRFPNELQALEEKNAITIRIVRPCIECQGTFSHKMSCSIGFKEHPSENSLDDARFKYNVYNDGTIPELVDKIHFILQKENIIS